MEHAIIYVFHCEMILNHHSGESSSTGGEHGHINKEIRSSRIIRLLGIVLVPLSMTVLAVQTISLQPLTTNSIHHYSLEESASISIDANSIRSVTIDLLDTIDDKSTVGKYMNSRDINNTVNATLSLFPKRNTNDSVDAISNRNATYNRSETNGDDMTTVHKNTSILDKNNASADNNNKYRLELLHIPKTGGTMLEYIAAKSGIVWGACHFHFTWKFNKGNVLKVCPPIDMNRTLNASAELVYWHYPLQELPQQAHHPYDNLLDSQVKQKEKKFFVVVRNPYDKLISLYYMKNSENNNATFMNEWVQKRLQAIVSNASQLGSAEIGFLPQYKYIWDNNGTEVVDHILRFEAMHQDFKKLRALYDLPTNLTISNKRVNGRGRTTLNRKHFTARTLQMIQRHFHKDFDLAGVAMSE